MTSINEELSLLPAGDAYWKATLKDWARQQELRQLQICQQFAESRHETRQQTDEHHKRLAEQMWAKMNAQVEKMRSQQDAIMKKFREAEKKVEEACKDAETVYETELEMIRNFHMRSESPSPLPPSGKKPGTTVDKCRHLRIDDQGTQTQKINYHNQNETDM
jgi:DNA repair exonuclease SbcCD ATPase subunit